jgi:hypothetical protein
MTKKQIKKLIRKQIAKHADALRGPQGPVGPCGATGATGMTGRTGDRGPAGQCNCGEAK